MGFRRFFAGETVSSFGDWFTYVAISVLAVGQPHDALALAVVALAQVVPRALLAPIAGALADRGDRRRLLVAASVGRGLATVAMAAAALAGWMWAVEACYVARMALGALTDSAARAIVPSLVAPERLARANALLGLAWNATFVAGVIAGGVTVARFGVATAFAIDAITFFAGAAVFATLERTRAAATRAPTSPRLAPHELRLALGKVPASLATGAAAILVVEGSRGAAIAIGVVHAARATGAGLAPLVWPRTWRTSTRGLHVATAIALAGVAAFGVVPSPIVAVVWGIGIGASWVTATTLVQRTVPDTRLGRAVAVDVVAQSLAQGAGGVVAAAASAAGGRGIVVAGTGVVLAAIAWLAIGCAPLPPPRITAPPPSIQDRLRARGVTDDDFYRPVLYSWTTPASIAALRSSHHLLVATAATGTFVSPFNRALAAQRGEIATLLTTRLVHRRYAWPAPYATVLGLGPRTYGHALIRIELRRDAWIGRFDPSAAEPFAFVDARGATIATPVVLAHPERLAAIFHVRRDLDPAFREYIVCNEAMVARWSIASPEIRAELAIERDVIAALRDRWLALARREALAPIATAWARGRAAPTVIELWRATLAFDNARYRPTAHQLDAMLAALAAYDGTGEALVVSPNP